jgi:hypothetical protein
MYVPLLVRPDARLTSRLLKVSRTAVSMTAHWPRFLTSGGAVEGNIDSTRSNRSVKSDLFNGGSTVSVCFCCSALWSISSRSPPKSSTA